MKKWYGDMIKSIKNTRPYSEKNLNISNYETMRRTT